MTKWCTFPLFTQAQDWLLLPTQKPLHRCLLPRSGLYYSSWWWWCWDSALRYYPVAWKLLLLSWTSNTKIIEPPHENTNKVAVRTAKTQISLGIRPVLSESSLSAWRKRGSLATLYQLSAQRRLWSDWADAQADLSLRRAHSHCFGFGMRRLNYDFDIFFLSAKSICIVKAVILQVIN